MALRNAGAGAGTPAASGNRALGQNFHYVFTATNADDTINNAFGQLTGYLDDVQWHAVRTFNTYTPPGISRPHDQLTMTHWEVTITGADKANIWTYISQFDEHQRQAKQPPVSLSLEVQAFDPDDDSQIFDFKWSDGVLTDATGRSNGLQNAIESTGTLKFNQMGN